MDITIIGTGNMARGIGARALAGGHNVKVIGKDADHAQEAVSALNEAGGDGSVEAGVDGDPLDGDVVVLAVYYPDARRVVEGQRDQLAGKPVVDITNPVNDSGGGVAGARRGLNAIDVGPQSRARELEALGLLHMQLQDTLGSGFASAVKFIA